MKCQHVTSRGPCTNNAGPSGRCPRHKSDANLATAYRLTDPKLREAVEFHAKGSLLDIRQQIVLMNAMIERRLNLAGESNADKIAAYNYVATQLQALTKMTETLVKLGRESGELMNRGDVEAQNQKLLELVISVLHDKVPENLYSEIVDELSLRLDEIDSDE